MAGLVSSRTAEIAVILIQKFSRAEQRRRELLGSNALKRSCWKIHWECRMGAVLPAWQTERSFLAGLTGNQALRSFQPDRQAAAVSSARASLIRGVECSRRLKESIHWHHIRRIHSPYSGRTER